MLRDLLWPAPPAEDRAGLFNVMLAVGSLIALPPSLLLAFFGVASVDIDPARSILDLGRYWVAYGLAWLPFAGLLAVGFLMRRRIRDRPRLGGVGEPIPVMAAPPPAKLPAPRAADRPDPASLAS